MLDYYCVTNTFSHSHGSCDKVKPKNKWIYSAPNDIEYPVLFVDNYIPHSLNTEYKNKFGWMAESSEIISSCCSWIKSNVKLVEDNFKKIFVNDISFLELSDVFEYVSPGSNMPWVKEYFVRPKTKLVSIIASSKNWTHGHRLRHEIVKNNPTIDAYGGGYKKVEHKEEALDDYMFSYCIENGKYDLYYTEKLTDCIATGTIPIYWGSDKISDVFNTKGFILYDNIVDGFELNEDLYESMIGYAKENLEILKSLKCSDDIIQEKIKENYK